MRKWGDGLEGPCCCPGEMRAKSEEMGSHGQGGHNMQIELAGFVDGVDWVRSVSEGKRRIESDLCFSLSN